MLRLFEGKELTTNRVQCRARSSIAEVRRKKTIVKGETDYWLEVIQSAGYFSDEEYASLDADNKELTKV